MKILLILLLFLLPPSNVRCQTATATTLTVGAAEGSAVAYTVREFDDATSTLHRAGFTPSLEDHFTGTASVFLGCHVYVAAYSGGDATIWPLVTVSDSALSGGHRYMRLQLNPASSGIVQLSVKNRGDFGTENNFISALSVGTGAWHAVGILLSLSGGTWTPTIYVQEHGEALETEAGSLTAPDWVTDGDVIDRVSYARHVFNNPATSAHQSIVDLAGIIITLDPTTEEIEDYMGAGDPATIWPSPWAFPDFSDLSETTGGADYTVLGTTPSDIGTLDLGP